MSAYETCYVILWLLFIASDAHYFYFFYLCRLRVRLCAYVWEYDMNILCTAWEGGEQRQEWGMMSCKCSTRSRKVFLFLFFTPASFAGPFKLFIIFARVGNPYVRPLKHLTFYTCLIFRHKALSRPPAWITDLISVKITRGGRLLDFISEWVSIRCLVTVRIKQGVKFPQVPFLVHRQRHFLRTWSAFLASLILTWRASGRFCRCCSPCFNSSKWSRPPWLISFLFLLPWPIPFVVSCNRLDLTWHAEERLHLFYGCVLWVDHYRLIQVVMFEL